jgi:restriction modification system DNA specificity domain protein
MKQKITIGEIAEINANSLTQKDMFQEIMYLDTGNITRNEIDNIQVLNAMMDKIPSRARRKVKDKTIIYSTVRPNQEHYGFLENPSDNFIVSTGFSTIDVYDDNTDEKFIYYLLTQKHITDYLHTIGENSVSSYPSINPDDIANLKFAVPDLKTQQSIVAVLSALDKKIALNKQINARLEEMAKTLYDYWFVQFDFPDASGRPYKSSGGEMVFDEALKREIPKGWEVKSLGEIALTSSGGTPTSTVQEYYKGGNIPWVNSGELNNNFIVHTDNFITQTGMDNSSAKLVSEKSILLAMYGATAGKTSLISFKTTTNQAICSILPKDMNYRVYIKSYLDNMYLYLVQLSSGSARDNLSQDKIKRLHLVIPESGILEIFSNVTEHFYKKIEKNLKQNHQLTQLRDFLLPMLMNGQVSVAE